VSVLGAYTTTTVTTTIEDSYTSYLDNFIDTRSDSHTTQWLKTRIPNVLQRIDYLQTHRTLDQKMGAVLGYVEYKLTLLYAQIAPNQSDYYTSNSTYSPYNTYSPYTPNINPLSTYLPTTISRPTRFAQDQLLVGGLSSVLNQQFEFSVSSEPMRISSFTLRSNISNLDEVLDEVGLYDENGRLIATATPINNLVTFRNINTQLEIGSHEWYLAALPQLIGRNYPGVMSTFTLSYNSIDAEGIYTRRAITPTIQTTVSTTITVAPVAITEVRFVNSRSSYHTDNYLIDGQTTLALLELETADTTNTDAARGYSTNIDTVLNTLTVVVNDNTRAGDVAQRLRLQRIDTNSSTIAGSVNGNTVTFYLNQLGSSREYIDAGDTAVFRITADINLDSSRSESVQLRIINLQNGGITYHSSDDTSTIDLTQQWESEISSEYIRD